MIKKGQKIHTRRIDIATYEGGADSVVVEGILRDERLFHSYQLTGKVLEPGTIHHMIIRMEVRGPQLTIINIEVEMPTVPHELCSQVKQCLAPVKGLSIVAGFTARLKKIAGGPRGCTHLVSLLTAMAPAAVQGSWSAMTRKPVKSKEHLPMVLERVKNSCWLWREDGPLIEIFKELE